MRDILVTILIFGSIPFILARPWIGILMWSWVGYMSPHRLTWGFAYNMPFAQMLAIATILGLFFSKEPKRIPVKPLTILWICFIFWMILTTVFSIYPDNALGQLEKVLKIQFVTFLTLMLINTRERIHLLMWVIVVSIGFFGIKGGLYTLTTGGSHRVWGPPGSFIFDNNSLGLATLMTIPLMHFLFQQATRRWVRWGLLAAIVLSAASVLGSQSRGAFLAGISVAGFFWLKSQYKVATGFALLLLIPPLVMFMPESWHERISTVIESDQATVADIHAMHSRVSGESLSAPNPQRDWFGYWPNDQSALGRINSWNYAINVANDRLTGAGFESWTPEVFAQYAPIEKEVQAAHSIYFSVLADHGWIGLFMFLSILVLAWRYASHISARTQPDPEMVWAGQLARAVQISLLAYMCGGAFLSLAYYDLPWHLIAILLICRDMTEKRAQEMELAPIQNSESRELDKQSLVSGRADNQT